MLSPSTIRTLRALTHHGAALTRAGAFLCRRHKCEGPGRSAEPLICCASAKGGAISGIPTLARKKAPRAWRPPRGEMRWPGGRRELQAITHPTWKCRSSQGADQRSLMESNLRKAANGCANKTSLKKQIACGQLWTSSLGRSRCLVCCSLQSSNDPHTTGPGAAGATFLSVYCPQHIARSGPCNAAAPACHGT